MFSMPPPVPGRGTAAPLQFSGWSWRGLGAQAEERSVRLRGEPGSPAAEVPAVARSRLVYLRRLAVRSLPSGSQAQLPGPIVAPGPLDVAMSELDMAG